MPLIVIQRQLGHSNVGITSISPQGILNAEIIDAVRATARANVAAQRVAPALIAADADADHRALRDSSRGGTGPLPREATRQVSQ